MLREKSEEKAEMKKVKSRVENIKDSFFSSKKHSGKNYFPEPKPDESSLEKPQPAKGSTAAGPSESKPKADSLSWDRKKEPALAKGPAAQNIQ